MKISTKKLLLAGILAGSLISYPNITFAADEDEEDISDVEISEDEEDIDTDIDEEESETTTTATETTTPVSSSTTSTGDELDNKLAYNTIEVGEN